MTEPVNSTNVAEAEAEVAQAEQHAGEVQAAVNQAEASGDNSKTAELERQLEVLRQEHADAMEKLKNEHAAEKAALKPAAKAPEKKTVKKTETVTEKETEAPKSETSKSEKAYGSQRWFGGRS